MSAHMTKVLERCSTSTTRTPHSYAHNTVMFCALVNVLAPLAALHTLHSLLLKYTQLLFISFFILNGLGQTAPQNTCNEHLTCYLLYMMK